MAAIPRAPLTDTLSQRAASRGRYRFFSILFGLGVFCAVFAVLVLLPFKYEAHVDILVRVDRDASAVPQMGGPSSDQIVVTGVRPEDIATEISILTGRQVAETAYESLGPAFFVDEDDPPENFRQRVIQTLKSVIETVTDSIEAVLIKLRMARETTPREEAIDEVMKSTSVSKSVRSDLISLSVRSGSPENATAILNAIASAYFDAHRDARAVYRGNALFKDLQAQTETEMTSLGERVQQSKTDLNVFDFPSWIEQRTVQLASLQADRNALVRERTGLSLQKKSAEDDLSQIRDAPLEAEPLNSSDLLSKFRGDLGLAVRDLELDVVRFGRTSQQVQEANAVIVALRTEMRQADIAQTQRLIRQFEREAALADTKADAIAQQIATLEAEVAKVSGEEVALRVPETKREALAASLAQITDELTRSEWLTALDSNGPARITILRPITSSSSPVAPNKVTILLAGVVISILSAIGLFIALTQKLFQTRYRFSSLQSGKQDRAPDTSEQAPPQTARSRHAGE